VSEVAVAKNRKSNDKNPTTTKAISKAKAPPKTRGQKDTEKQALAMWALLGAGGAAYGGRLKPEIAKAERAVLAQAGLIEAEKRARGAWWLTVTDRGWDWAEQHLADPLPDKTFGGAFVLQAWLARLQAFLHARDVRLAEVLATQPEPPRASPDVAEPRDHAELRERIRAAYLGIAGGFNTSRDRFQLDPPAQERLARSTISYPSNTSGRLRRLDKIFSHQYARSRTRQ